VNDDQPAGARPGRAQRKGRSRQSVTIREVAEAAGVSFMTVSNVLNSRAGTSSAETSARVLEHIARLGYRPQATARALRLASHQAIGMIIIDEAPNFLADPFITQLVAGLSNEVNSQGYAILLHGMAAERLGESPMVRNLRTDALCVLLSGSPIVRRRCRETLARVNQPVVLFQETLPDAGANVCTIRQDDFAGGRILGEHVLARGARHLTLLLPEVYWPAIGARARGIAFAARHAGPAVRVQIVRAPDGSFVETQNALRAHIERHGLPDAVLAGNDQMAIAAIGVVRGLGHCVPRDLMVTGFNGFDFWKHTEPMLTSIQSCAYELGARGGREVLECLRSGSFSAREIVLPVTFLPGASA
jgi:DNA-binding LacI/PurR family transcriptional regulator